jgi:signal-transduction protein with cAMP-binding, CBS, and nucleotidyltransferase domain
LFDEPVNLPTELREMTVADALRERVVAITTDQTLEEAARIMLDRGVTALAVIDVDSRDPGIITERDLGRAMASDADPRKQLVRDFVTTDVIAATCDWTLERAARTMTKGHIRHLMVVDDHKVIGILSMTEIVAAWVQTVDGAEAQATGDTGELPVLTEAHRYVYNLRRSAKQHMVAAKCSCEWEWVQVLEGQLEDRPDLDEETLAHLWDLREPCPALHAEGGGAD